MWSWSFAEVAQLSYIILKREQREEGQLTVLKAHAYQGQIMT